MEYPSGLLQIFAQTRLYTDGREYVMASVPLEGLLEGLEVFFQVSEPFAASVFDKDELSLVLSHSVWQEVKDRLPDAQGEPGYRLISFDLPLDLGLIGYIATVSSVLAEAGLSLLVFSAYQRDHLLVPGADFDQAWEVLNVFFASCREEAGDPV